MGTQLTARPRRRLPIASTAPLGLGLTKPNHFLEMARIVWDNRAQLPYAWRVLTQGVCDGCALGTTGLRDWTMDGTHLCLVRLNLLRLNTADAFDPATLPPIDALRAMPPQQLRGLGRVGTPLRRRAGEPAFEPVDWETALKDLGGRLRTADPDRVACYMTSRGLGNEVYFAAQKALRRLGSPHIDNAARLCHSPSTAAMKRVLGVAASTCSYVDWYDADLIVFFGSNPANDQPVAMKYLLEAKRRGASVLMVNTYDEPGMRRYWVPSDPASALFGSKVVDRSYAVGGGGDQAFVYAVMKRLLERGQFDQAFVEAHTEGFDALRTELAAMDIAELTAMAGAQPDAVEDFATRIADARRGVFVWSMGLTQHAHGTRSVEAVCCLGLSQGWVGRDGTGLMPIRGHSGVQGGAEMGAYSTVYPGGAPIDAEGADRLEALWGFRPPEREGLDTCAMLETADAGALDVLYAMGGNFLDTLPQPDDIARALSRVPVRIHQDIVLSSAMLVEPADVVYVLPARTRYEHRGGITETSTERRVIYSPHVPGHDVGDAREEWQIPIDLVCAALPEARKDLEYADAAAVRVDIAATIEGYRGIEQLSKRGDAFQRGGRHLCADGHFPLPSGRARFVVHPAHDARTPEDRFRLGTRRGKQFNSMVQDEVDRLTGAARDHLLMNVDDMRRLRLSQNQPVNVRSEAGALRARAFAAPMTPGNVQMHWPEANVLIASGILDAGGRVPDYNALVRIEASSEVP